MLAVIIPTYNTAPYLQNLLPQIAGKARLIIADGGSSDDTLKQAIKGGAVIAVGAQGRGGQLALGANLALENDWLLFIHADNQLPQNWEHIVERHIKNHPDCAGYFRFRADASGFWARFMDFWVALRCQWWGLPYGDQGLLISRQMYDGLGGYKSMPLFEDVDMIDRFKARFGRTRLRPLNGHMQICVEKYKQDGFWKRGRRNLKLLKAYRRGEDIDTLQKLYKS